MEYLLSKQFVKQFQKLPKKVQAQAIGQLALFLQDHMDDRLRNHSLAGEWRGYRSIDITGDIRAAYKETNERVVRFDTIGSHSELYG